MDLDDWFIKCNENLQMNIYLLIIILHSTYTHIAIIYIIIIIISCWNYSTELIVDKRNIVIENEKWEEKSTTTTKIQQNRTQLKHSEK